MNKKNPVLKIAGIFLVLGLALYFVGMAAYASEDKSAAGSGYSEVVYEKKEYSAQVQDITEILLQARNMPITVKSTTGSEITLHYYTSEKDPYDVALEGGVLSLRYRYKNLFSQGNWFSGWNIFSVVSQTNPEIEITVPEAYAGAFKLNTSNANVTVSGFSETGDVRAETSNGTVNLSNLSAAILNVKTSNGAVTLEKVISSGRLTAETSNGAMTVRQAAAQDGMFLHTSNGHITVDQVTSKEIELRSSNASITGSVGGKREEYTVSSSTSNADNNLGSSGSGQFRLTVNTSNGAINVRFLGE